MYYVKSKGYEWEYELRQLFNVYLDLSVNDYSSDMYNTVNLVRFILFIKLPAYNKFNNLLVQLKSE